MSTSSVQRSAPPRVILVVCSGVDIAKALARQTGGAKWRHYGLFRGWTGDLQGIPVAVVVAEPGEESAYVPVRQMVPLIAPQLLLYFSEAVATTEELRAGDVALIGETRRCYCPSIVTDNLFPASADRSSIHSPASGSAEDSGIEYPDDNIRRSVIKAPALSFDPVLTDGASQALNRTEHPDALQGSVPTIHLGSALVSSWRGRTGEYLASRYQVDAIDSGAYGVLRASLHIGVPAVGLAIITAGRGSDTAFEYRRRRSRYLSTAAAMTAVLIRQVAAESVTVTDQEPS